MYYFIRFIAYLFLIFFSLFLLFSFYGLGVSKNGEDTEGAIITGVFSAVLSLLSWQVIKVCNKKIRLEKEAYKFYKDKNKNK